MKISTRITAILTAVLLVAMLIPVFTVPASAAAWDGTTIADKFDSGAGTETNPYIIKTAEQLAYLSKIVGDKETPQNMDGKFIRLDSDIDLGGKEWTPIGRVKYRYEETASANQLFCGTFDGNNHTISNLVIETGVAKFERAGLFGMISGATIKNLNIVNANISLKAQSSMLGIVVGAIVDDMARPSLVSNCTTDSTSVISNVIADSGLKNMRVGGIVGSIESPSGSTVEYCVNNAKVIGEGHTTIMVGGIVGVFGNGLDKGAADGRLKCCINNGEVNIKKAEGGSPVSFVVGGILGVAATSGSGAVRVENCYNTGALTGWITGGIIGVSLYYGNMFYNNCNLSTSIVSQNTEEPLTGTVIGDTRDLADYYGNSTIAVENVPFGSGGYVSFETDLQKYSSVLSSADIKVLTDKIDAAVRVCKDTEIIPVIETEAETTTTKKPTETSATTPADNNTTAVTTTKAPVSTAAPTTAGVTSKKPDDEPVKKSCGGFGAAAAAAAIVISAIGAAVVIKRK